jgi:hypothetical protein
MKTLTTLVIALLFLPAVLIGYLLECARPGLDTGREMAKEG